MPLLVYSVANFTPLTKILSADVNSKFTSIATLLNTTGLDDTNIQAAGITRATKLKTGTAKAVVVNDSSTGAMSELTTTANGAIYTDASSVPTCGTLPTAAGGLGFAPAISASVIAQVVAVNAAGTALQLQAVPQSPGGNIFNFYNFS